MEKYFTKHHPPYHHREFHATYFYMANPLLEIDHKVKQEWVNAVLTPNRKFVITPNHTILQWCDNVIRAYGHKKFTTVTSTVSRGRNVEFCLIICERDRHTRRHSSKKPNTTTTNGMPLNHP